MKFEKVKERIFKPIKELDAEIRTIENEEYEDKSVYWIVMIGLCESMGEHGYNYTLFYDNKPTEEEIIKDIKEHIKEEIYELEHQLVGIIHCLGDTEERQLECLKRVRI